MADKQIPLPKEFLPYAGEPTLPYKLWVKVFENYMFMRDSLRPGDQKMSDEEKNRFLFTLLGLEGIRIFSAQPMADRIDTAGHAEFSSAVRDVFQKPVNPFRAYYDLEQRYQGSTESTQEFVTALRSLMADCDFAGRENHHLAVRLVCGCHSKDTQRKLLALPTVDLDQVIRIMQADETAVQCVAAMGGHSAVHRINQPNTPSPKQRSQPSQHRSTDTARCTNCGRTGHVAQDFMCPARGQKCRSCGKPNHFSSVCRSSGSAAPVGKQQGRRTRALQRRERRDRVGGSDTKPFHFTIHLQSGKGYLPFTAEVDTGAQISGVTQGQYRKHFSHLPLLPPITLRNFDGSKLAGPSLGRFLTNVKHKDRQTLAELHVLPPQCDAVIGQDLIHKLGLQIDGHAKEVRRVTTDTSLSQDFSRHLSEELGTNPDQHKRYIAEDAVPSADTSRPLPLTRRDEFQWPTANRQASYKLKQQIAKGVKTFTFDPNAPTYVTTDASDVGLGAVLSQIQHGREVPIAHASHTLQPRLRAYTVCEKEALACVWACEIWEKYLLGRPFMIRTDHSSLATRLQATSDTRNSARFSRLLDRLSAFDYRVEHRQGSRNVVADAFSRLSQKPTQNVSADFIQQRLVRALNADQLSLSDVRSHTQSDNTLSQVYSYVRTGWPDKKGVDLPPHHPVRQPRPTASPLAAAPVPRPAENTRASSDQRCRGPYRVGDKVLARRPQVLKGQSPWSQPLTVVQVLGHWTYRLSDGQQWNARKLRRFNAPEQEWTTSESHLPTGPRRSARHNCGVPPLRYPP